MSGQSAPWVCARIAAAAGFHASYLTILDNRVHHHIVLLNSHHVTQNAFQIQRLCGLTHRLPCAYVLVIHKIIKPIHSWHVSSALCRNVIAPSRPIQQASFSSISSSRRLPELASTDSDHAASSTHLLLHKQSRAGIFCDMSAAEGGIA